MHPPPRLQSVPERLHLFLLRLYRRLPTWARRRAVRTIAPSHTVGAICVIERSDASILLVRQAYRNHWGLPGGLLQRGEDAPDGARREVFEEVGLPILLIGEPAVVHEAEPQRVDLVFRAAPLSEDEADGVEPRSPEIVECRWFAPDALPRLQHEATCALDALARRG